MLKDIYPQYQQRVAFFAIGMDPFESLQELEEFREKQGHPWPVAKVNLDAFPEYNVIIRSTKIAVDRTGVIAFRAGYGVQQADPWHRVFGLLAG